MKLIAEREVKTRLLDLGFDAIHLDSGTPFSETVYRYYYEGDKYSQSLLGIARFVGDLFVESSGGIAVLSQLRIWPSSHDPYLIGLLFSSALTSTALPPDGAVLGCEHNNPQEVVTLFFLSMLFGWEIKMLFGAPKTVIYLSHDGWIEVQIENRQEFVRDLFQSRSGRSLYAYKGTSPKNLAE